MNIVITLPSHLIDAIISGEKTIEISKTKPRNFEISSDWVYVVERGTKDVVIAFSVRYFSYYHNNLMAWHYCKDKCGISEMQFRQYTDNARYIVLWHICVVQTFSVPVDLVEELGVSRAPQSYCYVKDPLWR